MPRKPSFSFRNTASGWKVEIPSTLSTSGSRERAFFKTRDQAREFAQELEAKYRAHGVSAMAIKPSLAEAAVLAEAILAPTGASLVEAASAYKALWDARNSSQTFHEAARQYLDSRSDLRQATLGSYRYTLESVLEELHPRSLADITAAEIDNILSGKAATSSRMHMANLKAFWRWAAKPPRHWCKKDLLDDLEIRRNNTDADIGILNPDSVRALLKAAEEESHAAAAAYAIAIFGGVRMAELGKLTWRDVKNDHIEIGPAVAKKHARRLVPLGLTLHAWLEAHQAGASADSFIVPANWPEISKAVRRRAGWKVEARILKDPPLPTRGVWPANACRHTCASVQVAIGTPLESLIFSFGHAGGHDLLRRHYVSRLTRKDALSILSIGPGGAEVILARAI